MKTLQKKLMDVIQIRPAIEWKKLKRSKTETSLFKHGFNGLARWLIYIEI